MNILNFLNNFFASIFYIIVNKKEVEKLILEKVKYLQLNI